MQIDDKDEIFAFPPHLQPIALHEALMATPSAKTAKKALRVRHKVLKPIISLDAELAKKYIDEDGNAVFEGEMLEEGSCFKTPSRSVAEPKIEPPESQTPSCKSLASLLKDAVIEKFSSRVTNANTWLDTFESECARLEVPEERFWEAIRPFLENTAVDWYESTRVMFGSATRWSHGRDSFLDAFAKKGWSGAREAFAFRFISGSLSDYALRKLNLIVALNLKMDEDTRISLIVVGLHYSVQDRIDHAEITSVSKLLSKINSLERANRTPYNFSSNRIRNPFESSKSRPQCPYCERKGFPGQFHAESECRTKQTDNVRLNSSQANVKNQTQTKPFLKSINSVELKNIINEIESESKN